jgi:hypothetical protein
MTTERKSRLARGPLQEYRNAVYIGHLLDDAVFDALNQGDDTDFLYRSGALDALDTLPAGSMRKISADLHEQSYIERGVSALELAEREEFINALFSSL